MYDGVGWNLCAAVLHLDLLSGFSRELLNATDTIPLSLVRALQKACKCVKREMGFAARWVSEQSFLDLGATVKGWWLVL